MYLIHWGSSVTVSPGVIIDLVESLGRLEDGGIEVSLSELRDSESETLSWLIGAGGVAAVTVKVIANMSVVFGVLKLSRLHVKL